MKYSVGDNIFSGSRILSIYITTEVGNEQNIIKLNGPDQIKTDNSTVKDYLSNFHSLEIDGLYGWTVPTYNNITNYNLAWNYSNFYLTKQYFELSPIKSIGDSPDGAAGTIFHIENGYAYIFRLLTGSDRYCVWYDYFDITHDFSITDVAYDIQGGSSTVTRNSWERMSHTEMGFLSSNIKNGKIENTLEGEFIDNNFYSNYWTNKRSSIGSRPSTYVAKCLDAFHLTHPESYEEFRWVDRSHLGLVIAMYKIANHFPSPNDRRYYLYKNYVTGNSENSDYTVGANEVDVDGFSVPLNYLHVTPIKNINPVAPPVSDLENNNLNYSFEPTDNDNKWCFVTSVDLGKLYAQSASAIPTAEPIVFNLNIDSGWNIFSSPIPFKNVTKIVYYDDNNVAHEKVVGTDINFINTVEFGETQQTFDLEEFFSDAVDDNKVIIIKNSIGQVYLPEYNFNGIGSLPFNEGLQMKASSSIKIELHGTLESNVETSNNVNTLVYKEKIKLSPGWNIFRYPSTDSINLTLALDHIVNDIIILKDNSGKVFIPEWGFNGIGDLTPGKGYQIKMKNTQSEYEVTFFST